MSHRIASLSLDLDNEWAYLRTHGDPGWESYPSYLPLVVPRILELLSRRGLTITFFVVGQDAAMAVNARALEAIAEQGHEIANHSMHHEPWLHLYTKEELEGELEASETHIQRATGRKPLGFRGPGYSMSAEMLEALARRGYLYDASSLPSFIGPLARAYFFATGQFSEDQKERLDTLFGGWREGLRPLKPYHWHLQGPSLIEIPVTTFPLFRVPIHLSYVQFLAGKSSRLAIAYFRAAIAACRMTGVEPSVLLHPLDFLGGEEVPALRFFPSMSLKTDQKMAIVEQCLDTVTKHYNVATVGDHAAAVARRPSSRTLAPSMKGGSTQ